MGRDAVAIVHEVDYWKGVLEDVMTLNELVAECARELVNAPIHLLTLTLVARSDAQIEGAAAAVAVVRSTMSALARMQEPLDRIVALTAGRQMALEREINGGEEDSNE